MRDQLPNAAWGVIDYAAYPVAMIVAAPTLLHHLGTAQYGVWVVCTAAISTGAIIASGFGDANIQHVATQRAASGQAAIIEAVRNMLGINMVLGLALTVIALAVTPAFSYHADPHGTATAPLVLAALLIAVRAVESVCISTQRAFERYGAAIAIAVMVRVVTVAAAVVLTRLGFGVTGIMLFTVVAVTGGTLAQCAQLKRLINAPTLAPRFSSEAFRALFGFGIFSWLQAVAAVLFTQADRLVLASTLGASAVTAYALCVQIAQPIYGISAAGLHFLFPYLAARISRDSTRPIAIAFALNFVYTALTAGTLLLFGHALLRKWLGQDIATASQPVLAPIVVSFALLSLSVPAYYALLAFARIRAVTAISLTGGITMLLVLADAAALGLRGIAIARVLYGLIALCLYAPLFRTLRTKSATTQPLPLAGEAA